MHDIVTAHGEEQVAGESGYFIKWEARGYHNAGEVRTLYFHFEAFIRLMDDGYVQYTSENPEFIGDVKWDGCVNILYAGGNYAHYCNPEDFMRQFVAMAWIYSKARQFFPGNDIEEWPSADA